MNAINSDLHFDTVFWYKRAGQRHASKRRGVPSDLVMCRREPRFCFSSRVRSFTWAFVFMCIGALLTLLVITSDRSLVCPELPPVAVPHLARVVTTLAPRENVTLALGMPLAAVSDVWQPLDLDLRSSRDVLAFIHIQKTGGSSFLSHLVTARHRQTRLRLCYPPSDYLKKRVRKKREFLVCSLQPPRRSKTTVLGLPEMWLVSEKTYGWICGLHPFLSEMQNCLPAFINDNFGYKKRNFHYFTIIRHPVIRFLSEYMHVRRGATWAYGHQCNGRMITADQIPACYDGYYKGKSWRNVSLDKFMDCPHNWAMNRQTVMLADLESVGCFNRTRVLTKERKRLMLESAKKNLEKIAFFGLSEFMIETEQLFEYRFKMKFDVPCRQKKYEYLHSAPLLYQVWNNSSLYDRIANLNYIDMELYKYAVELFSKRLSSSVGLKIDTFKLDKQIQALGASASVSYLRRYYSLKEAGVIS